MYINMLYPSLGIYFLVVLPLHGASYDKARQGWPLTSDGNFSVGLSVSFALPLPTYKTSIFTHNLLHAWLVSLAS